ncbi:hypothetical protein DY000_02014897 [Brassica cretica]|uniref:Protein kinase domain-containing protein n=1 Tax=Brassica cretica TaxID=69181 RepID=A0ABQ7CU96_BRACR|nr:hypothetical protein DY000_02014897 [Brassica cretica]
MRERHQGTPGAFSDLHMVIIYLFIHSSPGVVTNFKIFYYCTLSFSLQKESNSQISAKELMEHPFLKKYDDNSGINMESYFVDAGSLLPTLKNISDSTDSTYTTDSTPFILDVWTYSCLRMSLRVPACPGRVPLSSIRPPPAPTWLSELQHVGPSWHCPPPGYNSHNYATTRH